MFLIRGVVVAGMNILQNDFIISPDEIPIPQIKYRKSTPSTYFNQHNASEKVST